MGDHTNEVILAIVAECGPINLKDLYEEYGRRSYIYVSPQDFEKKVWDLFFAKKVVFSDGFDSITLKGQNQ